MSDRETQSAGDVRMRGFRVRQTVEAALEWLDGQVQPLGPESIPLAASAGRVLAVSLVSDVDVPGFDRATMDGYAVAAESTDGAAPYNPLLLNVIGESLPGRPFQAPVGVGQAVRIMTGAPLPDGCDAVLAAEWTDVPATTSPLGAQAPAVNPDVTLEAAVNALGQVSPGKHVSRIGEDIRRGTALFPVGRALRPQDVGLLSSVGIGQVSVFRAPRVRLVVTGNELLSAGSRPHGHYIADANGPMLAALVERDGGLVDFPGLVPDEPDAILEALRAAADVVIVSGGSSVGAEDHAPRLLAAHGQLAVHGIAMRPSSPTGLGRLEHRLVFLLPGNPVSCLCAYDFFAGRAIRVLGGRAREWPYRQAQGRLRRKISSPIGRLDYARVRIDGGEVDPLSIGGASVLSSTTRADGFVIVPADSEGFAAGTEVRVWLYG
jgi:molybdopterin molybdotransferase